MSENSLKSVENQIIKQVMKESLTKALQFGGCAAGISIVLFFGIFGFPRNSLNFVVDLLFIIVITLLTFAFTLSTISSNKLNSLGIKGNNEVLHKYEPFNYVSSFEQYPTTYNPATGLPMGGGVDARGNPYGLNNH